MFIERSLSLKGGEGIPSLDLHSIDFEDLTGLTSPAHEDVTKYLAPRLVSLVDGLCSADREAYDALCEDPETAFWGVYSEDELLAITGLFAIVTEDGRQTQSRSFCGVFDPNNFGLRIASRVMPVRSWYALTQMKLDMITSYIACDNVRSLKAVSNSGYTILGEATVPGTDIHGAKLFQFNPDLGIEEIQERAAKEAAELGNTTDMSEVVSASNETTKAHVARVKDLLDSKV